MTYPRHHRMLTDAQCLALLAREGINATAAVQQVTASTQSLINAVREAHAIGIDADLMITGYKELKI